MPHDPHRLWSDDEVAVSERALALARLAVRHAPHHRAAWLRLGHLSSSATAEGEAEAEACYRTALDRFPADPDLLVGLASLHAQRDATDEALAAVEACLRVRPGDQHAAGLRLDILVGAGRWDEAAACAAAVASHDPTRHTLLKLDAARFMRSGEAAALLERCDAVLARHPAHTGATFYKVMALANLGRRDEARALAALDAVACIDMPAPPGYADGSAFRQALTAEIEAQPFMQDGRQRDAVQGARRVNPLRRTGRPALAQLEAAIKGAIDGYCRDRSDAMPAFFGARPVPARLQMWATVFPCGGVERPHHHPAGWLSGVFYVTAPWSAEASSYRGPLVVGAVAPTEMRVAPPWETIEIEPVPGRLVLFPSHVPHATEPSGSDEPRISIAFDVVPA